MKKATKIIALVLAMILCVGVLAGCGAKEAPAKENAKKQVAVVFKLQDPYDVWLKNEFQAKADEYGFELSAFDFLDDETKFLEIMDNIAQGGYDLVVARTPKMDARAAIKSVQDSGAAYFHISSQGWEYIRDEKLAQGLVCNEYALGKVVADKAAEELPQNANVVVLLGPAGKQNSIDRHQAFQDVLAEKRPDVTILDAQIANWKKDEAMKKMDDWLQTFEKIDGVLSVNDGMATGAVESLISNGFTDWDNMYIYGIDGLNDACSYIDQGYMRASALQDAREYASQVMGKFNDSVNGSYDINAAGWFEFQPSLVDRANVSEQIDYYKAQGIIK